MLVQEYITQAQAIAGIGTIEGNAINENMYMFSVSIFKQTLNDVNSDPKLSLVKKFLDYQNVPPTSPVPPYEQVINWDNSISQVYPFPNDCRRVLRAFDLTNEWRKSDFSEVVMWQNTIAGIQNIFAITDKKIYLTRPSPLRITYVKEFKKLALNDEVDIPSEAESYLVRRLAYDLALSFNQDSIQRCKMMSDVAYASLVANTTINSGNIYTNPNLSFIRFDDVIAY